MRRGGLRQVLPKWIQNVDVCAQLAGATWEALAGTWQGHSGVCVYRPPWSPHSTSAEATKALIESAYRRLPRPATAHPGLALPTTHPGAALASLVAPGLACGDWQQRHLLSPG